MRRLTRLRLVVSFAIAAFGLAVAFAIADGVVFNGSSKDESMRWVTGYIDGAAGAPAEPSGGVRGVAAASSESRAGRANKRDGAKKKRGGDGAGEKVLAAAVIPTGASEGSGPAAPCAGTASCIGRLERLTTDVRKRIADLPLIRECTSSIGGEALCFDFGDGHYLVGDAPDDGQAELGFCASSGYYYVSGPSPDGGARTACPDDRAAAERGDPPAARECTSSTGGEATCFDFGGGRYIVSDPLDDGKGELGFCTPSGYYYVSAPSGRGGAGGKCPGTPADD